MNNKIYKLAKLLISDKFLAVGQILSAVLCYVAFAYEGNWGASTWCAIAAMMSLLYSSKMNEGSTINQKDIDSDEELADAVKTINDYVRRRDASAQRSSSAMSTSTR
jgi:hypothetical protein